MKSLGYYMAEGYMCQHLIVTLNSKQIDEMLFVQF